MKRIFLLKGLDCPNCSAKIEKEVGELDGVQSSVVNLMKQTLTINVAQTALRFLFQFLRNNLDSPTLLIEICVS